MDYLYTDKITRDFLANFKILDFYLYSEFTGYLKIQVEEEIFEYDISLQPEKDLIKKAIDRKTKKEYSYNDLFDNLYLVLPEHKRNNIIYSALKRVRFNEYLMYEVEATVSKGIAKKLREETQIDFIEYKKIDKVLDIYCDLIIFKKKLKIHFVKHNGYFIVNVAGRNISLDNWFAKEIKQNSINKETSLFYINPEVDHFSHNIENILGGLILQEFKNTKHCKMTILYDNELKDLLE